MSSSIDFKNYDKIKKEIEHFIGINNITPGNIMNIISFTMARIDKIKTSKDENKKQLCIQLIYDIVNQSEFIIDKGFILSVLDSTLDPFIENIIKASKGLSGINKKFNLLEKLKKLSCCSKKNFSN